MVIKVFFVYLFRVDFARLFKRLSGSVLKIEDMKFFHNFFSHFFPTNKEENISHNKRTFTTKSLMKKKSGKENKNIKKKKQTENLCVSLT